MKFEPLALPGCYLITLSPIADARGEFVRFFCRDSFAEQGLVTDWLQCNASRTKQTGSVRGMHFQHSEAAETKLIRCTAGAVLDVLVDMRAGSDSFGQWVGVELSPESKTMLYVAPGCAHGFQTLKPDTEMMYFHSANYAPETEGGVHHADPTIGIDWPRPVAQVSDRDSQLGSIHEVKPYT